LLVARLSGRKQIDATATAFRPSARPVVIPISTESPNQSGKERKLYRWLRNVFRF